MRSPILRATSSPRVFVAIRVLLGAVLLWASLSKIINPQGFAQIVSNYRILPPVLVNSVAIVLPWIEALCGLCLITGRLIQGSALIFVGLMVIFVLLTGVNIYRGLDINCGCFSVAIKENPASQWSNLLRNLVFLVLGIFLLRRAGIASSEKLEQ